MAAVIAEIMVLIEFTAQVRQLNLDVGLECTVPKYKYNCEYTDMIMYVEKKL